MKDPDVRGWERGGKKVQEETREIDKQGRERKYASVWEINS